jgi:ribosomal protein S18 acetylase RimI-like enzyme
VATETAPLTIRPLEERDLQSAMALLGHSVDHVQARWHERAEGRRTMFIAEWRGSLAGSVSFDERADFPGLLHLFALGVVASLQRRGIGTALIRAVEREAMDRGLIGIFLGVADYNTDAQRLYERLGYRREGPAFLSSYHWRGPNGDTRDIRETVFRMFRRFGRTGP